MSLPINRKSYREVIAYEGKANLADNDREGAIKGIASRFYDLVSRYCGSLISRWSLRCACANDICQGAPGRTFYRFNSFNPVRSYYPSSGSALCRSQGES